MVLINEKNGNVIKVGDKATNKNNENVEVVSIIEPNSKKPYGLVEVKKSGGLMVNYIPKVLNFNFIADVNS